jgi:hypothetical protein
VQSRNWTGGQDGCMRTGGLYTLVRRRWGRIDIHVIIDVTTRLYFTSWTSFGD